MRYSLHPPPRRGGFTLVEMMVATALIIFIMYILASAFEKGLESFRMLKVAGDMQERLRTAAVMMRSDLAKPHFNDPRGEYLSDPALDPTQPEWTPPLKGYFRIDCGSGTVFAAVEEGTDPDDPTLPRTRRLPTTVSSTDPTNQYPLLQFTVRQSGDRRDQYFTTLHTVPNLNNWSQPSYTVGENTSSFSSKWAEVTYFVLPTDKTPAGTLLYSLYRRVKLLYDDSTLGKVPPPVIPEGDAPNANLSFWRRPSTRGQSRAELNTPSNVTAPQRRWGNGQNPANAHGMSNYGNTSDTLLAAAKGDLVGTDLLLANVTDFEIKALWEVPTNPVFSGLYTSVAATTPTGTVDYPFDVLPTINPNDRLHRVFDTWSMEEDDAPSPEYSYGRPRDDLDGKGKVLRNGIVKGLGHYSKDKPNLANWNAGHFKTHINPNLLPESMPLRVRVKAVQIKIRIWDVKSQQSRQITLVQDL